MKIIKKCYVSRKKPLLSGYFCKFSNGVKTSYPQGKNNVTEGFATRPAASGLLRSLNDEQAAGEQAVSWDATGDDSGVYRYRLGTCDASSVKKMTVIK